MNSLLEKIKQITDSEVRPVLKADGGDIEIIDLKDNVLTVKVLGKCSSCPKAQSEVTALMETALAGKVKEDITVDVYVDIDQDLYELAQKILRKEIILP